MRSERFGVAWHLDRSGSCLRLLGRSSRMFRRERRLADFDVGYQLRPAVCGAGGFSVTEIGGLMGRRRYIEKATSVARGRLPR